MLPAYEDITSRLGEPHWWDEHGVPRYEPFSPRMLGVYAAKVALLEIGCQACPKTMRVSVEWEAVEFAFGGDPFEPKPPAADGPGAYHYGDPPRHECPGAGESMNCWDLRVLQYWEQVEFEWVRKPEHEIEWADEVKAFEEQEA